MNKNLNTAAKLTAIAGAFALAGCAFVPASVHPTYESPVSVHKIPGANKVTVQIVVKNDKKQGNEVSYKRDGLGIRMAGVYTDVKKDFTDAITSALQAKGFAISQRNHERTVSVIVQHFMANYEEGIFELPYTGTFMANVFVSDVSGKTLFQRTFHIQKLKLGDYAIGGAGQASKKLLNMAVDKIVNNPAFLHALLGR